MDKSYWTKFYAKHKVGSKPSLFAQFVWDNYLRQMQTNKQGKREVNSSANNAQNAQSAPHKDTISLLELGCGNGRDALFFAKNKIQTTAIDQVGEEISYLASHCATTAKGVANPHFIAGDFTNLSAIFGEVDNTLIHPKDAASSTQHENLNPHFDCIYSRFTLHSITHTQQESLLSQIPHFLAPSGIVAIEARGKKNSLYRQGEPVEGEANAFIHDSHYRRFVDFENLCEVLESQLNLTIHFAKEDKGFAPFNGEDDYFFRVVGIARNERERERESNARGVRFIAFIAISSLDSSVAGVSYAA